ncbi:MAG: c-type cytochrome [Steroidobacteraceae bacterium]|nr:c-type cytochrome [Steroidobacteraceae bacterium]
MANALKLGSWVLILTLAACSSSTDSEVMVVESESAAAPAPAAAPASTSAHANEELSPRVLRRFAPLDVSTKSVSRALTDLGRKLYYDPRLSKTGAVSCNTCHPLDKYGTTDTAVSTGVDGRKGARNAPSTYHASGHFVQFWDGRADTIEAQAVMPLLSKDEMGMSRAGAVAAIKRIAGYRTEFARAFPDEMDPVSFERIGLAIGAFEHGLVTPARWDRYLRGDKSALNAEEKAGAKLFANLGCIVCHTGPYIGGSMFERVGARVPWPENADRGRKAVTGHNADDMVFKVPSLRNVAMTAPYFHDGSAKTLNEAVRMMARHQLGVELEDDEARELEAWLGSLTGELPTEYIKQPDLPPEV